MRSTPFSHRAAIALALLLAPVLAASNALAYRSQVLPEPLRVEQQPASPSPSKLRRGLQPAMSASLPLLRDRPADAPLLLARAMGSRSERAAGSDRLGASRGGNRGIGKAIRAFIRRPQEVDARGAAALIKGGDRVFIPVGQATSNLVLKALAERAAAPDSDITPARPVELVGLSNAASRSVFDRKGKVVPRSLFLGANVRDSVAGGRGSFVPAYFGRIPRLIREGKVPVDVAVVQVSPPDRLGFVTLGPTAAATPAALEKAKVVIAQVNKEVPRTRGDTRVHVSKLDYIVRANEPLVPAPSAEINDTDRQIARHVVNLVVQDRKGATGRGFAGKVAAKVRSKIGCGDLPTFQFGIGGIPDAVAQELASSTEVGACRIRSEMIGPGTRQLVESGKVKGKVQYTFARGDESFLRWMHNNRKLVSRSVDKVNDPARIAKVPGMVAINSALSLDLLGQVNAQYVKGEWYSGVGGQVDFMRGAMGSKGGKAIIALPSVAMVSDGKGGKRMVSKIVPRLGKDDVVTTNMHDVQHVVTEHGVASLEGKSEVERARALIKIAHPAFRGELTASLEAQLGTRRAAEQRRHERWRESQLAGVGGAGAGMAAAGVR